MNNFVRILQKLIGRHPDSLSISVEERDIIELEKQYWELKKDSRTGKLDLETLRPLISPPVPLSVCAGVFAAFDENRDNHIDFKEMACGISAATRGPMVERQKCKFNTFLLDGLKCFSLKCISKVY